MVNLMPGNADKKIIIESKGMKIGKFYLPPFTLNESEIVVCFLYGGAHFYELMIGLAAFFTGKLKNENVTIYKPLGFVEPIKGRSYRRLFYPVTVGGYIKKHGNPNNKIAENIYNHYGIHPKTGINSLEWTERKMLSLYAVLSHNKNIILDFLGISPQGMEDVYQVLRENVMNGGTVLILDNFPDFKDWCTKFITVEVAEN